MHFLALLTGNVALALGPWFVRIADSGPVSAGLWRLFLALPLLAVFARARREPMWGYARRDWVILSVAGVVFALDLASWHVGIEMTRLGNATLFGNSGSVILMVWGLIALHRRPHLREYAAVAMALGGAGLLLGRSMEIDARTFAGDLFCILAGLFYVVYILLVQNVRGRFGSWSLLFWSSLAGCPVLLAIALALGEPVLPQHWLPVIGLMIASQIIGQGLLVYSLGHFPPLVIGLVLLTQPAVSIIAGWFAFGEVLTLPDAIGMALVGAALVLARIAEPTTEGKEA
ncbi:drug/metabolite transporter (DMT)-like permease [Novosphingobium hassiacum]|uniref:Drug/metabolite transporter (DMT)-like permease n=1 Tax=Novosphingobium hassiacum TaxID=173676 RepID=A0A7W6EV11_9SPHN|nr:DMT family transporter [Novosphingobium hassiacum]MBB3859833.1 drug/metabolite transporter (DMT)-like permease [Novosphingobium hassiacum]